MTVLGFGNFPSKVGFLVLVFFFSLGGGGGFCGEGGLGVCGLTALL